MRNHLWGGGKFATRLLAGFHRALVLVVHKHKHRCHHVIHVGQVVVMPASWAKLKVHSRYCGCWGFRRGRGLGRALERTSWRRVTTQAHSITVAHATLWHMPSAVLAHIICPQRCCAGIREAE